MHQSQDSGACNEYIKRSTDVGFLGADTDVLAIHGQIADTDNHYFQNF